MPEIVIKQCSRQRKFDLSAVCGLYELIFTILTRKQFLKESFYLSDLQGFCLPCLALELNDFTSFFLTIDLQITSKLTSASHLMEWVKIL